MLVIKLAFPAGRYHATPWGRHVNEAVPEWPPSPYRLLRALYDTWKRKRPDWPESRTEAVLAALASRPPLFALPKATVFQTKSYLSCNEEDLTKKTAVFDAFVAVDRQTPLWIGWPDLNLPPQTRGDLAELLSLLNYLGRSESWIDATLANPSVDPSWNCRPAAESAASAGYDAVPVAMPVPTSEYRPINLPKPYLAKRTLQWMDAIAVGTDFILKGRLSHPPAMTFVDYLRPRNCFDATLSELRAPSLPNPKSVLYALDSAVLPLITETVELSERVRALLMGIHKRIAGDPSLVSPRFSGKDASGTPLKGHLHAYFLPMDVNGDGRIDHLFIGCREPFGASEIRALDRLESIWQPGGRPDIACTLIAWDPARVSRRVESVTPFVLTRHWRPNRGPFHQWLANEITRECRNHGMPDPIRIDPVPELRTRRGRTFRWFEFRRNRKGDLIRSGYGLRLEFADPVRVPFSIGYGAHFGLGQFDQTAD